MDAVSGRDPSDAKTALDRRPTRLASVAALELAVESRQEDHAALVAAGTMAIFDANPLTREDRQQIDGLLGQGSWWRSLVGLDRVGPARIPIEEVSPGFHDLFIREPGRVFANLRARPKGLLVEMFGMSLRGQWAIPYHELSVYKSRNLSLHGGGQFVRLTSDKDVTTTVRALLDRQVRYLTGP